MSNRPTWLAYFEGIARAVGQRATCSRASVGALLVDWDTKAIIATGYNGAPRGEPHCIDVGCELEGEGTPDEHCVRVVHAEVNAVLNAARIGAKTQGTVLVLSGVMPVCKRCQEILKAAGVQYWLVQPVE